MNYPLWCKKCNAVTGHKITFFGDSHCAKCDESRSTPTLKWLIGILLFGATTVGLVWYIYSMAKTFLPLP